MNVYIAHTDTDTDTHNPVPVLCFLYGSTHAHIGERYQVCRSDVPKSLSAPPPERVGGFLIRAHMHRHHRQQAWERGRKGRKRIRDCAGCVCERIKRGRGKEAVMKHVALCITRKVCICYSLHPFVNINHSCWPLQMFSVCLCVCVSSPCAPCLCSCRTG